ncbi:MAG: hypothetical protein KDK56_04665 [Simkania sp.]|nr:hypothetical protein [Simkania sp.]
MYYIPPTALLYETQSVHYELLNIYSSCEFVAAAIETLFTQMQAMLSNFVGTIQRYVEDWTATPVEPESRLSESSGLNIDEFHAEFDLEGDDGHSQRTQSAIANINDGTQIRGGTTSTYMDLLEKQYGAKATFIHHLLSDVLSEPATFIQDRITPVVEEAIMQNKDFVFIPVVFQSRIEPHNVLFIVNIKDQVIEYYDPKGTAIGGRTIPLLKMSVRKFSEELQVALEGVKIQQSQASHQNFFNSVDCGRFVMHIMKQRLTQPSFEETVNSVKNIDEIKQELTEDLSRVKDTE